MVWARRVQFWIYTNLYTYNYFIVHYILYFEYSVFCPHDLIIYNHHIYQIHRTVSVLLENDC